ncbi:carbonic anhydrase [Phreatobacter sp.]|uniref:carbonic anhydrase n=1 Tax=Phreatobacter sp. TaxID=1966341 RepID=UPI003F715365
MCDICQTSRPSRRSALSLSLAALPLAAASLAGLGIAAPARAQPAAGPAPAAPLTPDQALERLMAGNRRFVAEPQVCSAELIRQRGQVATGQAPWASVVSCADSRVPPELVFGGLGLGELFVVRNAGNTVDTAALGTLEFGAAVLRSPVILVLGHTRCGAVAAACDVVARNATFPGAIGTMIEAILPAAISASRQGGDVVEAAIRENVRRTVERLKATGPILSDLAAKGQIRIVGGVYDLASGRVDLLA